MFKVIGIACLVITIDNNLVCVFEDEKKIDLRDSNKLDFFQHLNYERVLQEIELFELEESFKIGQEQKQDCPKRMYTPL